ncbi:MAG TPA: hypothetical protein VMG82_36465 [Candidatus Sulfotelmatobacter sp.]|nr:hypothetical protein [Candidatus Sulfotelmatobacter sp.]
MKRGVIIALLVGCSLSVWKAFQERGQGTPSFATTEEFIGFASQNAVAEAATYDHIQLDYSVESLKQVDEILGRVHNTYVKNPSSIHMRGVAAEYGSYVGEVIRRNQPNVYWTRDSKVMGEKSYALHWKAGESYPFTWCAERITNGEQDSIWIKYSVLNDPNWRQHLSGIVVRSKKLTTPH